MTTGSTGRRGRGWRRLVAALSAATAACALASLAGVPAASRADAARPGPDAVAPAAPATDRASITLTSVTPTVVVPGSSVTVTGSVTAPSTGPLTGPVVRLVLGDVELRQRAAVEAWAAGTAAAAGRDLVTVRLPSVPAGQSRTFTLTVPAGGVRSDEPFAALPLSVEVVQQGATEPTGVVRTFLAWHARKEYTKLQVATVLPVTLDPDLDLFSRTTGKRDAAWQRTIGPDSRLRRIIDGTRGTSVTLAVDPSVFGPDAGTATGPGTSTPSPSGTPAPSTAPATPSTPSTPTSSPTGTPGSTPTDGTGGTGDVVPRLAADLAAELRGRSLWALPYADADVAATVDLAPTNAVVRDLVNRAALVSKTLGQAVRADVVWPVDGLLPTGREQNLRTLLAGTDVKRPAAIVVNQSAVTGRSPYTPTARRVGTGRTRLLGVDNHLSGLLPRRTDATPVLSVQHYLAETLVLLGERPGTPRSVLLAAPRTYDPDPTTLAAFLGSVSAVPWVTSVDATSLLTDRGGDVAAAQQRPVGRVPSAAPAPALTRQRLAQMAIQRETLQRVADVLRDGAQFNQTYRELLDELASARWRYQPASWAALGNSVAADTRAATSSIRVVARSVNFLAENGVLQVTVENGLDYTVQDIRLVLAPTNPRIQVVAQPDPITIGPGSKTNVPVRITAVAAGRADIRAFLTTADGVPIGSPAVIPVSANPIDGTVYWVGGILVGLVLLAGVARAVLRGTSRIDEIEDIEALTSRHESEGHDE